MNKVITAVFDGEVLRPQMPLALEQDKSYAIAIDIDGGRSRHITVSPEVRFGKPCVADTRIAVEDIAVMYLHKRESLEKIALDYNLSLASVYAAIAYYYDNQEQIDRRRAEGKAFAEEFKRNNPSLLQEKLRKLQGERGN
ncbi:MAG: DUF433 domain-containing protein [Cyanobacteriota bacterium]|nr:DUF433 domain-containing protein [Cyanobacteriota bacterium]